MKEVHMVNTKNRMITVCNIPLSNDEIMSTDVFTEVDCEDCFHIIEIISRNGIKYYEEHENV